MSVVLEMVHTMSTNVQDSTAGFVMMVSAVVIIVLQVIFEVRLVIMPILPKWSTNAAAVVRDKAGSDGDLGRVANACIGEYYSCLRAAGSGGYIKEIVDSCQYFVLVHRLVEAAGLLVTSTMGAEE